MREVLLLDCILCTRLHVLRNHRDFPLLATNHGLELQHELKNASASSGCEENTERVWGGEPCEDKDIITPLATTVSFYQANLCHSPDNEEGKVAIRAARKGCTLELLPGPCGALCSLLLPIVFSVVTGMSCIKNIAWELRPRWFQSTWVIFKCVIKPKALGTVAQRNGSTLRHGLFYRPERLHNNSALNSLITF